MPLNEDFKDFIHHFNVEGVKYLIVGAYAVIYYTEPRYTKDIDFWIRPDSENAQKAYKALQAFGAPLHSLTVDDLANPEMVFQVGMEPNRIDVIMGVQGVDFDKAWKKRQRDAYGDEKVYFIGIEDLLTAKRAAGRKMDQIDVEQLTMALKKRRARVKKAR